MPPLDARLFLPHVARNRDPILAVLRRVLPARGIVLELASGTGEHAAYFSNALPELLWQPTDIDPKALASVDAHRLVSGSSNLLAPLYLDVGAMQWPIRCADTVVAINLIHIAPWETAEGLLRGARRLLPANTN